MPWFLLLSSFLGCGGGVWVSTTDLPDGRVALPYDVTLLAEDAAGPLTWSVEDGALPDGVTLDASGSIAGEPLTSGSWTFTVLVEDGRDEDLLDLTLTVPPVVLMSGYEPFGGYDTNPSWDALVPLSEQIVGGLDVRVLELPVEWDVAWEVLEPEIARLSPDVVLATGMAGTQAIRFEVQGVNVEEGEDNAGVTRNGEPVVEGGPDVLQTPLPLDDLAAAVDAIGTPTTISEDAGTFLCNFIYYRLLYHAQYEAARTRVAGFIHVPPVPGVSPFEVEDVTAAHEAMLPALAAWLADGAPAATRARVRTHDAPVYSRRP